MQRKKNINILQIVKINTIFIHNTDENIQQTANTYEKYTIRNKHQVINPGYVNVYLQRIFSNV